MNSFIKSFLFISLSTTLLTGCLLLKRGSPASSDDGKPADPPAGEAAPSSAVEITMAAAHATLGTGASYSSSAIRNDATGSTAVYDQCNPGSPSASPYVLVRTGSNPHTDEYFEFDYHPVMTHKISAVTYLMSKTGTVGGDILMSIQDPGTFYVTSYLASSTLTGSFVSKTFTFSPPVTVTAGSDNYFDIKGASGCGSDCTNYSVGTPGSDGFRISLQSTGSCGNSAFFVSYSGQSVSLASNAVVQVMSPTYVASATAQFTGDSGTAASSWYPSSFVADENSGDENGSYSYDVGFSDSSTATYSLLGMTKGQVKGLDAQKGRYVYIRVTMTGIDGFSSTALGDLSMSSVAP